MTEILVRYSDSVKEHKGYSQASFIGKSRFCISPKLPNISRKWCSVTFFVNFSTTILDFVSMVNLMNQEAVRDKLAINKSKHTNLGASWGTIGARGAGETSIFVPTRVSTSTPREGSTAR